MIFSQKYLTVLLLPISAMSFPQKKSIIHRFQISLIFPKTIIFALTSLSIFFPSLPFSFPYPRVTESGKIYTPASNPCLKNKTLPLTCVLYSIFSFVQEWGIFGQSKYNKKSSYFFHI